MMSALIRLSAFGFRLSANPLLACPMCFGDPNSSMVRGAKVGVLFLFVVIFGMLIAIASVARTWALRARALDAAALATSGDGKV